MDFREIPGLLVVPKATSFILKDLQRREYGWTDNSQIFVKPPIQLLDLADSLNLPTDNIKVNYELHNCLSSNRWVLFLQKTKLYFSYLGVQHSIQIEPGTIIKWPKEVILYDSEKIQVICFTKLDY